MAKLASVIERWLAAGDNGDFEAFDDLMHADVVVHAPAGLSTDSREAEKQVWRDGLAAIPDVRHAVQAVLVVGDTEMAHVHVTGTLVSDFGAGLREKAGATCGTSVRPSRGSDAPGRGFHPGSRLPGEA
jgi:ketosteroid isomerase-like protein